VTQGDVMRNPHSDIDYLMVDYEYEEGQDDDGDDDDD
jgi:hypothetical protein